MKRGHESQTAVIVAMARAAADGKTTVARFADPTALALLPDAARARIERYRAGEKPKGFIENFDRVALERRSKMMVVRTVFVDDAVRAANAPQLVILGAGLDGRAFRMPELRDVVVFEVDHPDSQREKQKRAAKLPAVARDVRFVPVDFARDRLEDALASAGHDSARPTTWIWEGVVMYLTRAEVEATLAVISKRSAAGSQLVIVYHAPAALLHLVGFIVRMLGEPLRSVFTADAMRDLLAKYGFHVLRDDSMPGAAAAMTRDIIEATRVMKHMRLVTAVRKPSP